MALSVRQSVEVFHLVFLRALSARGEDKTFFGLKGGCNLRFFFGSVRYSEDIDLDVATVAKHTLEKKIECLLSSPTVVAPLKAQGIEITDVSAPKQTETTQRWKLGLTLAGASVAIRTKIEFSRRAPLAEIVFASLDRELLRGYGQTPFLASHYGARAAIAQKIQALSGRSEPQARDVFDLNLLLSRVEAPGVVLASADKKKLSTAIDHALALSFDEYASQVVAFLDPLQSDLYRGRHAWDEMQSAVVDRLQALSET